MPQIFRIGPYTIYFWLNEGAPLEPLHVHVSEGIPSANATKIWITRSGRCLLCNNNSRIPKKALRTVMDIIEAQHEEIAQQWLSTFGDISYYC